MKKTAIVTGGGRGIGLAIVEHLVNAGYRACLIGQSPEERYAEAFRPLRENGAEIFYFQGSIAEASDRETFVNEVVSRFGRIDVLVNNAGVTRDNFLLMMRESDYDAVLDTNLKGTFLCIKNVVHAMMKQNYGRIVNVSSVTGLRGNAGQANYAASKAGVIGLTKAAAKELAMKNITVNAVAPGFIETDMTAAMTDAAREATLAMIPAGRLGQAQEVARAVAFLASDDAAYISGQNYKIDGCRRKM